MSRARRSVVPWWRMVGGGSGVNGDSVHIMSDGLRRAALTPDQLNSSSSSTERGALAWLQYGGDSAAKQAHRRPAGGGRQGEAVGTVHAGRSLPTVSGTIRPHRLAAPV